MTRILALLAVLIASPALAQDGPVKGVVELFTSQGCSSCPAADAVLEGYAAQPDVLALSWHVDYWNYLGWADTFSKADFTQRQQLYALSFERRGVYTPQAVVNGRDHAVGSRKAAVDALLNGGVAAPDVALSVNRSEDAVWVACKGEPAAENATLSIVYYLPKASVAIGRGENGGRTVTYHNVVRGVDAVAMVKDGGLDTALPMSALKERAETLGASAAALLLQVPAKNGVQGPIVAAYRLGKL